MRKKEIVTLALTTVILMTTPVMPVSATEIVTDEVPSKSLHIITPQWTSTNTVVPLISISGKKISVSVAIDPKKSTTTSVGTLYLEKRLVKAGRLPLHGRLMQSGKLVLPKPTTAQQVLPTEPE